MILLKSEVDSNKTHWTIDQDEMQSLLLNQEHFARYDQQALRVNFNRRRCFIFLVLFCFVAYDRAPRASVTRRRSSHMQSVGRTNFLSSGSSLPSTHLHGRELGDELVRDVGELVDDLADALPEARLVEVHAVLLAERLDERVHLGEIVARHEREEVVVDLVVEPAREPVHEEARRDVARRSHLELPEVGLGLALVDRHAVVADGEDERQEQAAEHLRRHVEHDGLQDRHVGVHWKSEHPGVVHEQAELLATREVNRVVAAEGELLEHVHVGLEHPAEARKQQQREVEHGLVADHEGPDGGLEGGRGHVLAPGEQRHGVDVRVAQVGRLGVSNEVGHCVVEVVLVLPPLAAEALPDISNNNADEVAVVVLVPDLVVQHVMSQPAGLLPEEPHDARGHENQSVRLSVGELGQCDRGHADTKRRQDLPRVVRVAGVVEPESLDLDPQATVSSHELLLLGQASLLLRLVLAVRVGLGLGRSRRLVHVANVQRLEQLVGRGRVEDRERVGRVLAGLREHDLAPRMAVPGRNVVHLVVDHDPGVVVAPVLLDLSPRNLAGRFGLRVHHNGQLGRLEPGQGEANRRLSFDEKGMDASGHGEGCTVLDEQLFWVVNRRI